MHGNTRTFSEQVIPRIIYDSRCGISNVAFRTAPSIGGPSCVSSHKLDDIRGEFKIYCRGVAAYDVVILKGNDVVSYLRSTAKRLDFESCSDHELWAAADAIA